MITALQAATISEKPEIARIDIFGTAGLQLSKK
jgi:hypothetical protein